MNVLKCYLFLRHTIIIVLFLSLIRHRVFIDDKMNDAKEKYTPSILVLYYLVYTKLHIRFLFYIKVENVQVFNCGHDNVVKGQK